jgi:hypothetical protein
MGERELIRRRSCLGLRSAGVLAALGAAITLAGCGNMLYAINANAASRRLEEARKLGAERLAPYEYYYAREHLLEAQSEAAEADYGDAAELASVSEEYAVRAVEAARAAQGAGK